MLLPIIIIILVLLIILFSSYMKTDKSCYYDNIVKKIKIHDDSKKIWKIPSKDQQLSVAIVEPRKHKLLPYVLYNMANIYGGGDVSLYIFHGTENECYVKDIIKDWKNVQLVNLNVENLTINDYNKLLTSTSFYDNFLSKFVLIFQTDSIIRRKIDDDFFQYDYVGAPWKENCEVCVGNGGFSLRNVDTMKFISKNCINTYGNEDVFFSNEVYKKGFSLPDVKTAARFSSELTLHPDPCGFHAINKFHNRKEVEKLLQAAL